MRDKKLFIGQFIRALRDDHSLTQASFAERLEVSTSYINQLENNQRHATASILLGLAEEFDVDIASLSDNEGDRLLADMKEALADSIFQGKQPSARELKMLTQGAPSIAKAFLSMHQAMRRASDRLAELDGSLEQSGALNDPTPYDEVRDFFHYKDNYIDVLDRAGEALAKRLSKTGFGLHDALVKHLSAAHQIRVSVLREDTDRQVAWELDEGTKTLFLNSHQDQSTHTFQMAHVVALLDHKEAIEKISLAADFHSKDADALCRVGLANYFAGATLLPYEVFLTSAKQTRHDLQRLAHKFEASLEQVAHRLSTLQRAGQKGVPFFFARVDQAGNITKRHSSTKLQFARFGSSCPLWNVHAAFSRPGEILRQLAETPDGVQYLCLSTEVQKPKLGFRDPMQRYAITLGCEIEHAGEMIYGDDLDTSKCASFDPIGISCRICERVSCHQRAVPPLKRDLKVSAFKREKSPYTFEQ